MRKPPPGWNKTLADLFDEIRQGKRLLISGEEGDWACDYERSLLPSGTIFPRAGQVWVASDDCEVTVHYIFATPSSSAAKTVLPKDEKVRITNSATNPEPISVSFAPVRYDQLQDHLVPWKVRRTPRYGGYGMSTTTAFFNAHFRRVDDVV